MKRRFVFSMTALLLGTGWTLAEAPTSAPSSAPAPAVAPAPPVPKGSTDGACGATCGATGCGAEAPCVAGAGAEEAPLFWVSGEYLLWHIKNGPLPPLASMNTVPLFVPGPNGTGGSTLSFSIQNTIIFPEGMRINDAERSGGRITAGVWLDSEQDLGIEASGFVLERRSVNMVAQQSNTLDVAVPAFVLSGQTGGTTVAANTASTLSGTLTVDAQARASSQVWGAEANARTRLYYYGNVAFDVFGGARYIDLRESLAYNDTITLTPNGPLVIGTTALEIPASTLSTFDAISGRNQFYGPQIGGSFDWHCGRVFLFGQYKVALGEMHQTVDVMGLTTTPDGATSLGGVLVAPGDVGQHHRDHYAFVQEVTTNLGYYFTPYLRGFVGYNFLFLQNVARPGEQIGVSETHTRVSFGGTATDVVIRQPEFRFSDSTLWIQGVNFGLELKY